MDICQRATARCAAWRRLSGLRMRYGYIPTTDSTYGNTDCRSHSVEAQRKSCGWGSLWGRRLRECYQSIAGEPARHAHLQRCLLGRTHLVTHDTFLDGRLQNPEWPLSRILRVTARLQCWRLLVSDLGRASKGGDHFRHRDEASLFFAITFDCSDYVWDRCG